MRIRTMPNEMPGRHPVRAGSRSTRPTTPERPSASGACWCRSTACSRCFRARFIGKCSPVHFFWGSFDLAVTRFSGRARAAASRRRAEHAGLGRARGVLARGEQRRLLARATSRIPRPSSTPTPIPSRRASATRRAAGGGALRQHARASSSCRTTRCAPAPDPDDALLAFLQSTYEAAAERAALGSRGAGDAVPPPMRLTLAFGPGLYPGPHRTQGGEPWSEARCCTTSTRR